LKLHKPFAATHDLLVGHLHKPLLQTNQRKSFLGEGKQANQEILLLKFYIKYRFEAFKLG
jgi:hypothetical protein